MASKEMAFEEAFADMKRCTACILPETFPGIRYDDKGVCNYCESYEKVEVRGEEALRRVLSKYRNKGEKYDCIVPISGGRDSSFILHQMVKEYDMRVLSLTVDSGAITPEGYRNIEKITRTLNIDHAWIRDKNQIKVAKQNTKTMFHAWLKRPSINTIVPVLNSGDKTMNLRIFRYAHENRIPLVLGGNNISNTTFEQEHFKTGFMGVYPNERGYYSIHDSYKLSFLLGLEFLKNPHNYHLSAIKEYLKGISVYFFESKLKPKDVRALGFFDFIYWNEMQVVSTILSELGWRGASDTTATWRIDDAAYPLIDYLYLRLVGFNEFDEFYSKLVREGQVIRKEALRRCLSENAPRIPSLMRTFEELDVTKEQVDRVVEQYRTKLLARIKLRT